MPLTPLYPYTPYILPLSSAIQEDGSISTAEVDLDISDVTDITGALYDRLHSAMSKREVFRVIIILPVHPEGNLDSTHVKTIMRCEYIYIYTYRIYIYIYIYTGYIYAAIHHALPYPTFHVCFRHHTSLFLLSLRASCVCEYIYI
jgi:hypothetical protein